MWFVSFDEIKMALRLPYSVKEVSRRILEHEIACLDVNPLDKEGSRTGFVAVGLWTDVSIRILYLPDLEEVHMALAE